MSIFNTILIIVIFVAAIMGILYYINKNKNAEVEQEVEKDDKTYTLDMMREFVKKRLDEITKVKASHILISNESEAKALKSQIDEGASFEELAQKYSKCPSGANGGDLGYFRRGQMVKEFEDAAFETEINAVSDPIKTQFGYHLIKVYDKK